MRRHGRQPRGQGWRLAARAWPAWLMLGAAACRIDQLESEMELTSTGAQLELTREPGAPPPRVLAELTLSEFAQAHFAALELHVALVTGQGLEGQGLFAVWSEGARGEAASAPFAGPLHNELRLSALPSSLNCAPGPCRLVVALEPRGSWQSDVPYPLRYDVYALLTLEREERLPLASDLGLQLELVP